jgi:glycosyltransferase involved in cell wall biosynthesis
MKILIVHNAYQQGGGEDVVAANEARLLAERGHSVIWYRRDNDEIRAETGPRKLALGLKTVWAPDSYGKLRSLLKRESPNVAHFHNTFPLISPAAYHTCSDFGVPVVQTLHNYRLLCPGATFFRNGQTCEECLGGAIPWRAVIHGCYRESTMATAAVAAMLTAHRFLGTWQTKVDRYVAVSEFARRKFVEGGLPAGRLRVKPNFVYPDPGFKTEPGAYAFFAGRLSEEKGARVLLDAWGRLKNSVPLWVAGEGPLRDEMSVTAAGTKGNNISLLGTLDHCEILALMQGARFLVFPSILFEGAFPLAVIEAFATGLPTIASRLGPLADGIVHGYTGLHFKPGNSAELAELCDWAWTHTDEMQQIGRAARAEYEHRYSAEKNYEMLMEIYESVLTRPAVGQEKRVPHPATRTKAAGVKQT